MWKPKRESNSLATKRLPSLSSASSTRRSLNSALPAAGDGVADQVDEHLPQAVGVAHQCPRDVAAGLDDQLDAVLDHRGTEDLGDLVEHLHQLEGLRFQLQHLGLDLGEVEDVVDEREQPP